jgi:histidinol-phosphate/aromatic aminotransferase/cobyric acid decarboxylase-like protein/GNAT superfamily N-acetyltransferase
MIRAASPSRSAPYDLSLATSDDRPTLYRMRHAVYASELGQHAENVAGRLEDPLDEVNDYVVVRDGDRIVGFVSITPPSERGYSIDKYLGRDEVPVRFDGGLYELRLLTVAAGQRGSGIAALLMYAAFRWISSRGATQVVVLGRKGATVGLYARVGIEPLAREVRSGAVTYQLMTASVDSLRARVRGMADHVARLARSCTWSLPIPFHEPAACYHGGASIAAIGDTFDGLDRAGEIIAADVLDAWFPPAPAVLDALRDHLPHLLRTSPPTDCAGLLRTIAEARGLDALMLVPGAGSSDLIFRAFREWLSPASRVLMLDPTYGEYAHIAEAVVGCRVDRLPLVRERGYRVELDELCRRCGEGYDLVVLVNPNSPTGQVLHPDELSEVLRSLHPRTRLWVDETYIDYCGDGWSMEPAVARHPNLVVCKSMSKVYALSGARVAYLCAAPAVAQALRAITPPWAVGAPAQLAAIRALREPGYYRGRYGETHRLRAALAAALRALDGVQSVTEGVANFLLCHLDPAATGAERLLEHCRGRGLYLRDLRSMGGRVDPGALRIAVKDEPTNRRMVAIFEEALDRIEPVTPAAGRTTGQAPPARAAGRLAGRGAEV